MTVSIDLHTHTRFFHGSPRLGRVYDPLGARLLAAMARQRGLDGIATTNHDYYRELGIGDGSLTVVPGIEVTTTQGHALIVGPSPPKRTEVGELTPKQITEIAHERDCATIIPHPFRNSTVRNAEAGFDAIEINGKGTESYDTVRHLSRERNLPLVGGSDAHYPFEVGRAFTEVDAPEATPEAVVDAIRDGRVDARVATSPSQRLLRSAYKVIHSRKGWLNRPEPESPGVAKPPGEDEQGRRERIEDDSHSRR